MPFRINHLSAIEQTDRRLVLHTFRSPKRFFPIYLWLTATAVGAAGICWAIIGPVIWTSVLTALAAGLLLMGAFIAPQYFRGYRRIEVQEGESVRVFRMKPSGTSLLADVGWLSITEVTTRVVEWDGGDFDSDQLGVYVTIRTTDEVVRVGELYADSAPKTTDEAVRLLRSYFGGLVRPNDRNQVAVAAALAPAVDPGAVAGSTAGGTEEGPCPRCGARLPFVRDAFCPECREPLG